MTTHLAECEALLVPMPLAADFGSRSRHCKCNPSPCTAALTHLLAEARYYTRGALLRFLCLFVEDGIGAYSPFVSPTTHNGVSCLFRGIANAANLGILCFASSFFPLSALNEGKKRRCADSDNGTGFWLRRCKCSREDAGASTRFPHPRHLLCVYSTEARRNRGLSLQLLHS